MPDTGYTPEYMRKLERCQERNKPGDEEGTIEVIYPLETVEMSRSTGFEYVRAPTEQGRMLLEFIKRHLLKED